MRIGNLNYQMTSEQRNMVRKLYKTLRRSNSVVIWRSQIHEARGDCHHFALMLETLSYRDQLNTLVSW